MATTSRNLTMKTVRVKKETLLETLRINRDKHSEEFKEASEGYRDKLLNEYRKFLKKVSFTVEELANTKIDLSNVTLHFHQPMLTEPEDHTEEYSTAIEMLEWSVDTLIDLQLHEFEGFVQDKWEWSGAHNTSTIMYGKK